MKLEHEKDTGALCELEIFYKSKEKHAKLQLIALYSTLKDKMSQELIL